jgi:hypothetical protein
MMRRKNGKIIMGWVIVLVLGFMATALAEPEEEAKKTVVVKELQGEVGGISSNFIAVLYGMDAKKEAALEMALAMDKDVKIEDRKSLKDIGLGDIVSVSYEETTETKKEGDKDISRILSRVVKKIRFIRPGAKLQEIEMRSLEEPEQPEETPKETE